jgi:minor extracellular serine protease Vpr
MQILNIVLTMQALNYFQLTITKKTAVRINDAKAPQRYIIELESPAIAKYQGGISTYVSNTIKDKNSKLDI